MWQLTASLNWSVSGGSAQPSTSPAPAAVLVWNCFPGDILLSTLLSTEQLSIYSSCLHLSSWWVAKTHNFPDLLNVVHLINNMIRFGCWLCYCQKDAWICSAHRSSGPGCSSLLSSVSSDHCLGSLMCPHPTPPHTALHCTGHKEAAVSWRVQRAIQKVLKHYGWRMAQVQRFCDSLTFEASLHEADCQTMINSSQCHTVSFRYWSFYYIHPLYWVASAADTAALL